MANHLIYTPELAAEICRRLANGETLKGVCRTPGYPTHATVRLWALEDRNGFRELYNQARDMQLEALADEALDIADDGTNDWVAKYDPDNPGYKLNGEHSQRSKLRVDTRLWLLSRLKPGKYGNRLDVKNNTTIGTSDALGELLSSIASSSTKVFGDRSE